MAESHYVCPTCGYEDIKQGLCPDCSMDLEEVCPDCGNAKSDCVCELNKDEEEKEEEGVEGCKRGKDSVPPMLEGEEEELKDSHVGALKPKIKK